MSRQENVLIRQYRKADFPAIHELNMQEQWGNLVAKELDTKQAWINSTVAIVAEVDGKVVGCLRGLTDGFVSLYICELLVSKNHRKAGIGKKIMQFVHSQYPKTRMELLASSTSRSFYEAQSYRPFYGFRKTMGE
ncbi:GNAT family acetyltransferase [Planococcus antarcticus DSM 14505]|uniref:GNAT family N-acetyltransferase n=1 Tax=Planococcus antarcticus DSM 14505 TaxID=1185653 RepID=A0A1C7DD88_9BACL|nr:GNAT family N-acetyltransferase [Planococcus antarcticus]ANU09479.1 GNAT family N-acetyltransferase [Planococcus antarcticus DSM 14505]EIM06255.1 GNAT family acetyltransferase [Planococcus antarcticus DSM 14505]